MGTLASVPNLADEAPWLVTPLHRLPISIYHPPLLQKKKRPAGLYPCELLGDLAFHPTHELLTALKTAPTDIIAY